MGGGKKRKSVNKSEGKVDTNKSSTPLNGNDSDYGVFSDPDEMSDYNLPKSPQSPQSSNVDPTHTEHIINETATLAAPIIIQEDNDVQISVASANDIKSLDKSLDTLKMKLEKDAVYSNKITLTTFFSYIILAMEIDIACSPSITTTPAAAATVSSYDSANTERLIEYIIRNHSSTPEVEEFTATMLKLGIITHIVNGVIEFNRTARASTDTSSHSHTLQSLEQLNLNHKKSGEVSLAATTATETPTPKQTNCFIRFWRNMSLCCCKCRKSRKESILENNSHDSDESNKSNNSNKSDEATTKKNEEVSSLNQSNAAEEMKELTI